MIGIGGATTMIVSLQQASKCQVRSRLRDMCVGCSSVFVRKISERQAFYLFYLSFISIIFWLEATNRDCLMLQFYPMIQAHFRQTTRQQASTILF